MAADTEYMEECLERGRVPGVAYTCYGKAVSVNGHALASAGEDEFLAALCYGSDTTTDAVNNVDKQTESEAVTRNKEAASDNDGFIGKVKRPNVWLLFINLLASPKIGWRRIKSAKFTQDEYARKLFFPLLAVMAICRFVDKIYYTSVSTGSLLQKAVAGFVAFFGGYFLVGLIARTFLPNVAREKINSDFGRIFIMTVMSALALSAIIAELLPWLGLLLAVMPIYSAYILAKGVRCLRVPEEENRPVTALMTFLCIGVPVSIYYLLVLMMPQA